MSAMFWLIGLLLLVAVLFLLALLKPKFKAGASAQTLGGLATKSPSIQPEPADTAAILPKTRQLHRLLAPHLADCVLSMKANRVLITKAGRQVAIVTIDAAAVIAERLLDDVLILTISPDFDEKGIEMVAQKITAHIASMSITQQ